MIKQEATLPSSILLAVIAMLTITACTSEPQIGAPDSTPVEQKKPVESSTIQSNKESSSKNESSCPPDLTPNECLTLGSITLIDDHPLYTMRYQASYDGREPSRAEGQNENQKTEDALQWGCSLFAAFADNDNLLFGRNFDWRFSPAILLFTDPEDGYASLSMVDYEYLGFDGYENLEALPIEDKIDLLQAPYLPFDGLNEHGLAIGMAAVPPGQADADPSLKTIDSLHVIREMLDHAKTVPEAVSIFKTYNIDMGGGPPLHYLMADPSGNSALLEFYQGELVQLSTEDPWFSATNFLRSPVNENPEGHCWRLDTIEDYMQKNAGMVTSSAGLDLLEDVSQANTQWSILYDMGNLEASLAVGRDYSMIYDFRLEGP